MSANLKAKESVEKAKRCKFIVHLLSLCLCIVRMIWVQQSDNNLTTFWYFCSTTNYHARYYWNKLLCVVSVVLKTVRNGNYMRGEHARKLSIALTKLTCRLFSWQSIEQVWETEKQAQVVQKDREPIAVFFSLKALLLLAKLPARSVHFSNTHKKNCAILFARCFTSVLLLLTTTTNNSTKKARGTITRRTEKLARKIERDRENLWYVSVVLHVVSTSVSKETSLVVTPLEVTTTIVTQQRKLVHKDNNKK